MSKKQRFTQNLEYVLLGAVLILATGFTLPLITSVIQIRGWSEPRIILFAGATLTLMYALATWDSHEETANWRQIFRTTLRTALVYGIAAGFMYFGKTGEEGPILFAGLLAGGDLLYRALARR